MANRDNLNKNGSKSHVASEFYVVDSGRIFKLPLSQGINSGHKKPERQMLALVITWLFYCLGLPFWLWGFFTYTLGWIKEFDLSHITVIVGIVLSLSKAVVMWAEKGEVVWARCKRLFKRKRKQRVK